MRILLKKGRMMYLAVLLLSSPVVSLTFTFRTLLDNVDVALLIRFLQKQIDKRIYF